MVKIFFLLCSASGGFIRGLQSEPVMGAHTYTLQARACFIIFCVRENRNRRLDSPIRHSTEERPGVRSCHTLPVRQAAHRRPGYPARSFPGFIRDSAPRPFKAGCGTRTLASGCVSRQKRNLRVGDSWVYAVGAWGKICARQTCRYKGQTAAHGQIT